MGARKNGRTRGRHACLLLALAFFLVPIYFLAPATQAIAKPGVLPGLTIYTNHPCRNLIHFNYKIWRDGRATHYKVLYIQISCGKISPYLFSRLRDKPKCAQAHMLGTAAVNLRLSHGELVHFTGFFRRSIRFFVLQTFLHNGKCSFTLSFHNMFCVRVWTLPLLVNSVTTAEQFARSKWPPHHMRAFLCNFTILPTYFSAKM